MKVAAILAAAGIALVPAGTASAGETGLGKAYGNCGNSSAGGVRAPIPSELRPAGSKGNGGLQALRGAGCTSSTGGDEPAVEDLPVPDPAPVPADPGVLLN